MKIGLLGTPASSGNRGVMALGASLVSLCCKAGVEEVALFVGHRNPCRLPVRLDGETRWLQVINYRLSPRARPREHLAWILLASLLYRAVPWQSLRRWLSCVTPWIAALERMDAVGDIRGGDSFSDLYGLRRFGLGFLAAWTVVLIKGGLMQFPQTFGPFRHPLARWLAGYLLRRSSVIVARDRESQRMAQELVGPAREVRLSPDVAFALEAVVPGRVELWPAPECEYRPAMVASDGKARPLGINVNGLMFNGGYTRSNMFGLKLDYAALLPVLVQRLLAVHPGEVWLVPHTYGAPESVESDPEACRRVRLGLPESARARVRLVAGEYDCHEIKGVIGQCDLFIGSRMHACIAALSQGIPTVGIAYSRKFEGVFETVGMRDWVVDGRTITGDEALARVLELYRQRDAVRDELKIQAERSREQVKALFARLFRDVGCSLDGSTAGPEVGLQAASAPAVHK